MSLDESLFSVVSATSQDLGECFLMVLYSGAWTSQQAPGSAGWYLAGEVGCTGWRGNPMLRASEVTAALSGLCGNWARPIYKRQW